MRIWLCDDEEVERNYLAALVEEWAKAREVPLQLCVFPGAEALLFAQNGGPQADLLLRGRVCQDTFCGFSKLNDLSVKKSPKTSCLQMS